MKWFNIQFKKKNLKKTKIFQTLSAALLTSSILHDPSDFLYIEIITGSLGCWLWLWSIFVRILNVRLWFCVRKKSKKLNNFKIYFIFHTNFFKKYIGANILLAILHLICASGDIHSILLGTLSTNMWTTLSFVNCWFSFWFVDVRLLFFFFL